MRVAGDIVLGSGSDQHGDIDFAGFDLAHDLAGTPRAGGERLEIALGRLGEGAVHPLRWVDETGERRRLHRLGNGKRKPGAIDKMMAETAENHRAHAASMLLAKKGGDPAAPRRAHTLHQ